MFKESLIDFEVQVGDAIEKESIPKSCIYGFVEKQEHGLCIITSYGIYKLITPKEEVLKQIEIYEEFLDEIDKANRERLVKAQEHMIIKATKEAVRDSERDRLFGDQSDDE
jgi:hypothetical protein